MATHLHVEKPGMESAAQKMEKGVAVFREAVTAAQKASDDLNGMWMGEQQVAFAQQQAEYTAYCKELAKLVDETIAAIRESVKVYTNTDEECAKLLRAL